VPAVEPIATTVTLDSFELPARQALELEGHILEGGQRGLERGHLSAAQLEVVVGHGKRPLSSRVCQVE
jgi:hypothetical protein